MWLMLKYRTEIERYKGLGLRRKTGVKEKYSQHEKLAIKSRQPIANASHTIMLAATNYMRIKAKLCPVAYIIISLEIPLNRPQSEENYSQPWDNRMGGVWCGH